MIHVREVQTKMTKQSLTMSKITTSIWGATFTKARRIYSAVVRPTMSYGSTVWHSLPLGYKGLPNSAENKLSVIQKRCLRIVSGAYKATPIRALRPRHMFLPWCCIWNIYRLRISGQSKFRAKTCKKLAEKLKNRTGRTRIPIATPGKRKPSGRKPWWANRLQSRLLWKLHGWKRTPNIVSNTAQGRSWKRVRNSGQETSRRWVELFMDWVFRETKSAPHSRTIGSAKP